MFNFKKMAAALAFTIALTQAMTVVPVYATEQGEGGTVECKHDSCTNPAESDMAPCDECKAAFLNEEFYEIADAEKHNVAVTCACGDTFTGEEPHWDYNNGVCICGYDMSGNTGGTVECKHDSCTNPAESDKAPCDECKAAFLNEDFYEVADATKHNVAVTCTCGDVFTGEEPHWDYQDGKCICGYELTSSEVPSTGEDSKDVSGDPVVEETVNTEEERNQAIAQAVEEQIKEEEALPVTSFVSAEAVNALPAEVKADTTGEVVFNVSQITSTRGFVAAVDKIVKENAEETNVTFYSANPFAFNVDSLFALTNANKEFVYMFTYNGQLYKITIPAGAKIDMAGQRFAGPLFIGAQLGTSVLIK